MLDVLAECGQHVLFPRIGALALSGRPKQDARSHFGSFRDDNGAASLAPEVVDIVTSYTYRSTCSGCSAQRASGVSPRRPITSLAELVRDVKSGPDALPVGRLKNKPPRVTPLVGMARQITAVATERWQPDHDDTKRTEAALSIWLGRLARPSNAEVAPLAEHASLL